MSASTSAGNAAAVWSLQRPEDRMSCTLESAKQFSNSLVYFRGKRISAAERHGWRVPNGCAKGSDWQTHKIIIV